MAKSQAIIIALVLIKILLSKAEVLHTLHPTFDKNFPDKCFYPQYNLYIPRGKSVPFPNRCGKVYCSNELHLRAVTCQKLAYPPNCVSLGVDSSQDYPGCCEKWKCSTNSDFY